jgi:hypothetical protein
MIKSKEIAGPSCLTAAADDEPLFVLRANDELAPQLVWQWACMYLATKGVGTMTDRQQAKYREAVALAEEMKEWRKTHVQV